MEGHSGAGDEEKSPTAKRVQLNQAKANDHLSSLAKRLVGTKSTVQVKISGNPTPCLLDTGSQVTAIPLSYHAQFLADQPIQPLTTLLEGANGQEVPYQGYVELCVTFLNKFVEAELEVHTLASVVPSLCGATSDQVLIRTNTLDLLYAEYCQSNSTFLPIHHGYYRAVLKIMALRYKHSQT